MYLDKFRLNVDSKFVGEKVANFDDGTGRTANRHHSITVERDGDEIKFDFYPSVHHPVVDSKEDILTALGCFMLDASCANDDIDAFADEYGMHDVKVSQVIDAWKGCKKAKRQIDALMTESEQRDLYEYLREGGYL